jgi:hypothetical protein
LRRSSGTSSPGSANHAKAHHLKTPDQPERLGQAGTAFEQHLDTFRGCRCDDTTQHFGDAEVILNVSSWLARFPGDLR